MKLFLALIIYAFFVWMMIRFVSFANRDGRDNDDNSGH